MNNTIRTYLPGKLGNPNTTLEQDKRADPRIIALLKRINGFGPALAPVPFHASYEDCLEYCAALEELYALAHPAMLAAMPEEPNVERRTEVIKGEDDNEIKLFIHQALNREGPRPCIFHIHGGGMVTLSAEDPNFVRLRNSLAATGMLVIGVEFRNGGGKLGNHPFPAGLNDCVSGLKWVHARRKALGISSIVVAGESGGGNLSIATGIKAKREQFLDHIDGIYAMCPYIYGQYDQPSPELLSLVENEGYMLSCQQMSALSRVYDPARENCENPLAWPYHAQTEDLQSLPPHIISVNELDLFRDEGLMFYRKLLKAGVSATARTVHGTPHAGDLAYPDFTPEIFQETLRSIHGFAESLGQMD